MLTPVTELNSLQVELITTSGLDVRAFSLTLVDERRRRKTAKNLCEFFGLNKLQYKDVAMFFKVKYQNTKKYIRLLSGFTFLDFIAQVRYKFGLPDATELDGFDETNTVVEEDIFSEPIEASPDICLTVNS
ncbi:hypothetical protein ATANTOWER_001436 [Ataeniobius toweri]|uniref:Uncharacterized protein n=1 Tax=Ataeniobius toweri TaxID=208326 RepID=A0ABU7C8V7_9TELE|nr:hypothetical protein [Ataeniobius toweri]